jgi:predicted enzyme related to lactoylglutathione lyase
MSRPNNVGHFAIECDDVERAKRFYEAVFGWRIVPWGPPDYYQVMTGTADQPGILGDLRTRREPLSGTGNRGYECTIGVESLADVMAAIETGGGRMVSRPFRIEGVGDLAYFEDTEGNRAGIMQYGAGLAMPEGSRL